ATACSSDTDNSDNHDTKPATVEKAEQYAQSLAGSEYADSLWCDKPTADSPVDNKTKIYRLACENNADIQVIAFDKTDRLTDYLDKLRDEATPKRPYSVLDLTEDLGDDVLIVTNSSELTQL